MKKHIAPLGTPFVQARLTVSGTPAVHVTVIMLLPALPWKTPIGPELVMLKLKALVACAGRSVVLSVAAWASSRRMVTVFACE